MYQKGFFIEYLYKEVFIISTDLDKCQRIEIYTDFFDVMELLNHKIINHNQSIKVVHGYLLPAIILPSNFNNVSAFIFIDLPNINYELFSENTFYNSNELAVTIQTVINHNFNIEIEDVFILYGTEIVLTPPICEDELDEEFIERSKVIIKEVKQVNYLLTKENLETKDTI